MSPADLTREDLDQAMAEFRDKLDRRRQEQASGIPEPPKIQTEVTYLEKREESPQPADEKIRLQGA